MAWLLAKTAFGRSLSRAIIRALVNWSIDCETMRIVAFSFERLHGGAGECVCFADWFYPNQTGTGLEMKAIAACRIGGVDFLLGGSVRSSDLRYSAHGS